MFVLLALCAFVGLLRRADVERIEAEGGSRTAA